MDIYVSPESPALPLMIRKTPKDVPIAAILAVASSNHAAYLAFAPELWEKSLGSRSEDNPRESPRMRLKCHLHESDDLAVRPHPQSPDLREEAAISRKTRTCPSSCRPFGWTRTRLS